MQPDVDSCCTDPQIKRGRYHKRPLPTAPVVAWRHGYRDRKHSSGQKDPFFAPTLPNVRSTDNLQTASWGFCISTCELRLRDIGRRFQEGAGDGLASGRL